MSLRTVIPRNASAFLVPIAVLALAVSACDPPTSTFLSPDDAPHLGAPSPGQVIGGRFIVTVRADADPARVAAAHGVSPGFVYRHALNGFAGPIHDAARAGLMSDARVLRIEPDRVVAAWDVQENATWGLDRIDQRPLPLDSLYHQNQTGAGVQVYIIDSGIRLDHEEFAGRLIGGHDVITSGGDASDCHGHGTHVAGTAGGTTWGVAKAVKLSPVRVLNCEGNGTVSGVVAGIDWVTANHVKPAVANMSLGGGGSTSLDNAVRTSIEAGITYVVAAGNGDSWGREQPACNYSPARVREALTVGSSNSNDGKALSSNYGECVDLFAPGVAITSAWHGSPTSTNTVSGTSMASPHVAGAAALYLETNPTASAATVFAAIYDATTKNIITSSSTDNNHLLYSLAWDGSAEPPPPPANEPPSASFTYSCAELSCSFTDTSTDSDGTIVARDWTFGDGATSTAQNPSHTYDASDTYTVSLTVTDDDGATDTTSSEVTVTSGGGAVDISLSVVAYKVRGRKHADLSWSGATSTNMDVYRDGAVVATVANTGSFTHATNENGGGSHTYQVCEAGTSSCSNQAVAEH